MQRMSVAASGAANAEVLKEREKNCYEVTRSMFMCVDIMPTGQTLELGRNQIAALSDVRNKKAQLMVGSRRIPMFVLLKPLLFLTR